MRADDIDPWRVAFGERPEPTLRTVEHPNWALVLGGAAGVWDEVLAWEAIYGKEWDGLVIAANDVGCHWPRPLDHWCTLHPENMPGWAATRIQYRCPGEYLTWGRKNRGAVDRTCIPWAGGSSGMLAVQVAGIVGCRKAILCGIPMTPTPHFSESLVHNGQPWTAVAGHWQAWTLQTSKMMGWVKSMSGRTRKLFGEPTLEWLHG